MIEMLNIFVADSRKCLPSDMLQSHDSVKYVIVMFGMFKFCESGAVCLLIHAHSVFLRFEFCLCSFETSNFLQCSL